MGSWSTSPLGNDSGQDLRYKILKDLQANVDRTDEDDCELTTVKQKRLFVQMIPQLLQDAKYEKVQYDMCDEAHCVAQFILQNNLKLSAQNKTFLIDLLQSESFHRWREPEERKQVVEEIIKNLRNMP